MSARAELSSLATGVEELLGRVSRLIEGLAAKDRERLAGDLAEAERSLRTAQRRISRALERGS